MQKCYITHYLALHGKNVILQLHYNYTLPLPQACHTAIGVCIFEKEYNQLNQFQLLNWIYMTSEDVNKQNTPLFEFLIFMIFCGLLRTQIRQLHFHSSPSDH